MAIWQVCQSLCATQMESCAQNKQITAMKYISDTKEIVKASWLLFQHHGPAGFKSSEGSPSPSALSANELPGAPTDQLKVRQMRKVHRHPAVVLAMGPGRLPAVRNRTGKTVLFSSRPVLTPDLLPLGGPNLDLYPSTHRFHGVWLDLSGPISGSAFQVGLVMVAFRYAAVNRKIFIMVHHCCFWMYWPPL